jgi:phage host-nuclease inhibitor protein Gam
MAPRIKPKAVIVADAPQAEAALAEMAELDLTMELHTVEMNEAINAAKASAKAACAPLETRRKELEQALASYAELNKATLFKARKSLDLGFGVLGFRLSTCVKTVSKATTWEMVLQKLKDFGFAEAIRIQESVDKDVLRTYPDERLATVGVKREVTDVFFIEINKEAVRPQGGQA